MKEQCRSCGDWYEDDEMHETDYGTYVQKGDLSEMVCGGCYDNYYGKCQECGEIREEVDLVNGICNPDIFEACMAVKEGEP